MIKENDLILQKNKSNSLGNLNLPKIVSNYQNNIQYKTNNPQNSKRKTIKIKLNSRRAKTQRKIDFRTLKTNIELVKSLDIDLKVEQLISREFDSLKLKEKIDQNPDIILKRLGKYKSKQIREEKIYVPRAEQESFPLPSRPSREINIKFNDGVNVVNIKMDDSYMVAELINEYFEKTKEKNRTFIFNNEELSPMDASPLYEVGLKNNSVIFVQ